jgi:hypothetical protein
MTREEQNELVLKTEEAIIKLNEKDGKVVGKEKFVVTKKELKKLKNVCACSICVFFSGLETEEFLCMGQGYRQTKDVYNSTECKKLYALQIEDAFKKIDNSFTRTYRLIYK